MTLKTHYSCWEWPGFTRGKLVFLNHTLNTGGTLKQAETHTDAQRHIQTYTYSTTQYTFTHTCVRACMHACIHIYTLTKDIKSIYWALL